MSAIKHKIIKHLDKVPDELLKEVYAYLMSLEKSENKKERILSYAGSWSDMDDETFDFLVKSVRERRKRAFGSRRDRI